MLQPLLVILICLVLAYIFSELFKMIGLPKVAGQITAGFLLSFIAIKYAVFSKESLDILSILANLGIILLFYYLGLETNFRSFTKNINRSILISILNTSLPFIIGFLSMRYIFNLNNLSSCIVGVCLSVSAQSVSVDILEELKMLKSKIGSIIISAGAVDDVVELLMTAILLSSFHFVASNLTIIRLIIDIILFLLFIVFARVWFIPWTLKFFDREKSSTSRFMSSMIIVLLVAILSEYLGIGTMIGAMIAGMIVRQTIFKDIRLPNWEEHDIARSTHIISFGFLIPLFFVWVGLNTSVNMIFQNIWLITLFILIATIGTVSGTVLAIALGKGNLKEGLIIGWGLNPKGDIELIIATLALNSAIITHEVFTSLVVMSFVTTIISSIAFKRLALKYKQKHISKH